MAIWMAAILHHDMGAEQMGFLKKKKKSAKERLAELDKVKEESAELERSLKTEAKKEAAMDKVPKPPKKFKGTFTDKQIEHFKDEYQHVEEWSEMKERKKFGFFGKMKIRFFPATTFLIHMEFSNGTLKNFVLKSSKETFKYKGRMYYLRYEDSIYHLTHRMYELRYHEDFPVPIDREIHKNEDTKAKNPKAFFAVTSHNLRPLIKMEYVKALAEAQELSKYLKLTLIVGLVVLMIGLFSAIQLYRLAPLG